MLEGSAIGIMLLMVMVDMPAGGLRFSAPGVSPVARRGRNRPDGRYDYRAILGVSFPMVGRTLWFVAWKLIVTEEQQALGREGLAEGH